MSEMPDFYDAIERAAGRAAFSNGTEGDAWMSGWCRRDCRHDDIEQGGNVSCPLIEVALLGETPAEWGERTSALGPEMYTCVMYEAKTTTRPYASGGKGDLVAMICDGGSPGGLFPTACGRDFAHPSHPLGQPPNTAGSSLASDQFSTAAGPITSCPSCESATRDGLTLGRKAIDKGDGPEWCDDEWHDQEDTDTGS